MANETLEERVSTLETKVAELMAVEHDTLSYSTEQIEAFFGLLDNMNIRRGTEEITSTGGSLTETATLSVSNVTANTRVVASIRQNTIPNPFNANLCLHLRRNASGTAAATSAFIAELAVGTMAGAPSEDYVPSGTYYIDWVAFEEA